MNYLNKLGDSISEAQKYEERKNEVPKEKLYSFVSIRGYGKLETTLLFIVLLSTVLIFFFVGYLTGIGINFTLPPLLFSTVFLLLRYFKISKGPIVYEFTNKGIESYYEKQNMNETSFIPWNKFIGTFDVVKDSDCYIVSIKLPDTEHNSKNGNVYKKNNSFNIYGVSEEVLVILKTLLQKQLSDNVNDADRLLLDVSEI
jgi:predicted membrane protein